MIYTHIIKQHNKKNKHFQQKFDQFIDISNIIGYIFQNLKCMVWWWLEKGNLN